MNHRVFDVTRRGLTAAFAATASGLVGACSPLTAFNTLAPRDPATRAGRDIPYGPDPLQSLDVFAPVQGARRAPVLLFFHGGGWNSGRRQDYAFVGQALASRGFVTVVAGYRLAPQVVYPGFMDDAAAATRWARDHASAFGGDADNLMVCGHSAGAYIAMMLALDPSFLRAAKVDPAQICAVAGLSGPYQFLPLDAPETRTAFGGFPDLPSTQPINHIRPGAPPAFLAHGSKDTLVWVSNTIDLGRALTTAGDVAEVKIYPGLSHADMVLALSRTFRHKAPVLDDMTAFLMAHQT